MAEEARAEATGAGAKAGAEVGVEMGEVAQVGEVRVVAAPGAEDREEHLEVVAMEAEEVEVAKAEVAT
jgi:hypothetical protein